MEFFIQELPKLPNSLLGAKWFVRSSHAKKWKRIIGAILYEHQPIKRLPFAYITLTRHSPRMCDFDGLVGSFKAVLDALVTHGVIEDDSPKFVEVDYQWTKTPTAKQGVSVKVEGGV